MADQTGESRRVPAVDTEPTVSSVVRDFRAMANLLAETDSIVSSSRTPDLVKIAQQHQLSLLTELTLFVDNNPEIGEYYRALGAYVTGLGLEKDALEDDDRFYESRMFGELFEVEDEVVTDTTKIYVNRQLLLEDEAQIVLFEILEEATEPLSGPDIRELGLQQYVRASSTLRTGSKFSQIKGNLEKRLAAMGHTERIIATGKTSSRRYRLDLSGLVITRDKDPSLTQKIIEQRSGAVSEPVPAPELPVPPPLDTLGDASAAPQGVGHTLSQSPEPSKATEPSAPEAVDVEPEPKSVLIIRGDKHYFSVLERRIIDAVLEGNNSVRGIVAYLQGGDRFAEQEFYHEIMQTLNALTLYRVGETRLLTKKTSTAAGQPQQTYELPLDARLVPKRHGDPVLRFFDPSTTQGIPGTSERRRDRAASQGAHEATPETNPQPAAAAREEPAVAAPPSSPQKTLEGSLSGLELSLSDGRSLKLEPQQKHLLEILSRGQRMTIADIVTEMHGQSDATVNSVIAQELEELKRVLGTDSIRRKKGKSGSPARWWIDPAVFRITTQA